MFRRGHHLTVCCVALFLLALGVVGLVLTVGWAGSYLAKTSTAVEEVRTLPGGERGRAISEWRAALVLEGLLLFIAALGTVGLTSYSLFLTCVSVIGIVEGMTELSWVAFVIAPCLACLVVASAVAFMVSDAEDDAIHEDGRPMNASDRPRRDVTMPPIVPPLSKQEAAKIRAAFDGEAKFATNAIGMEFRLIQPGTFQMGSRNVLLNEAPARKITISRAFYVAVYEVTEEQYRRVMGATWPSLTGHPQHPVGGVSWTDAQLFCRRLSSFEKVIYRLPTEAEWEYACRAGSIHDFGEDEEWLGDYAWSLGNSGLTRHMVGAKAPNAWGLYDMHGNVAEWCEDWYGSYWPAELVDPRGPATGVLRVVRGGSHGSPAARCRSAARRFELPEGRAHSTGFRVVRERPSDTPPTEVEKQRARPRPPKHRLQPLSEKHAASLRAAFDGKAKFATNSFGMKFKLIQPGTFKMKSADGHPRVREMIINEPFYLGIYEVTQDQYVRAMRSRPSSWRGNPDRPVESVSFYDARSFCKRLSALERCTYRLPTEAEWEYSCRAGSTTAYCFGNSDSELVNYAWFIQNSEYITHAVGQKRPNAWGLHDMHGNVWEWCANGRVRGGSWRDEAYTCRSGSGRGFSRYGSLVPEKPSRPADPTGPWDVGSSSMMPKKLIWPAGPTRGWDIGFRIVRKVEQSHTPEPAAGKADASDP